MIIFSTTPIKHIVKRLPESLQSLFPFRFFRDNGTAPDQGNNDLPRFGLTANNRTGNGAGEKMLFVFSDLLKSLHQSFLLARPHLNQNERHKLRVLSR